MLRTQFAYNTHEPGAAWASPWGDLLVKQPRGISRPPSQRLSVVDLIVHVQAAEEDLTGDFIYNAQLWREQAVQPWTDQYVAVLEAFAAAAASPKAPLPSMLAPVLPQTSSERSA
jgi:hypothetical protein